MIDGASGEDVPHKVPDDERACPKCGSHDLPSVGAGMVSVILDYVRIPSRQQPGQSALHVVALGRKNFMFVGHEKAGDNIAGLYSLTATCGANGISPSHI